ncbi:MAG: hypothetical protein DRR19_22550 [Candidatus Parabeggiatoa sp. nov. 1]|nr:MAG: hypothetical protein DRR19_22550 [Gammaproteobacteria bacterium]
MKPLRPFFLGKLILCLFSFPLVYAMPDCLTDNAVFQLHFLNKGWRDYKRAYQNPTDALLSERITDLRRDSLLCITEEDIDLYNWPSQTIFFNQNFIRKLEKLKQALEKAPQLELKVKSEDSGTAVFVLVFRGSRRYGGVVNQSSAAGYDVPTLFFRYGSGGRIAVTVRPLKTFKSQMTGYSSLDDSLKQIIEIPEIREFFLGLGKLTHNDDPSCVKGSLPKKECDFNFLSKRRLDEAKRDTRKGTER